MKNFSLAFAAILFMSFSLFSQNNAKEIPFDLKRLPGNFTVGGSLVVDDGQPRVICETKNSFEQVLFQTSGAVQTLFVEVGNSTGNSCVSLIVTTSSGSQKKIVPIDSSTGVLRFDKVKSVILRVEPYNNITGVTSFDAKGLATIWF